MLKGLGLIFISMFMIVAPVYLTGWMLDQLNAGVIQWVCYSGFVVLWVTFFFVDTPSSKRW